MPCAEAYLGCKRENMEASGATQELGDCRNEVGEVAKVSMIALRTG